MTNKKSRIASIAIAGFFVLTAFIFTGCNGGETKTNSVTSDTTKTKMDTTFTDSATTRPVKTPDSSLH